MNGDLFVKDFQLKMYEVTEDGQLILTSDFVDYLKAMDEAETRLKNTKNTIKETMLATMNNLGIKKVEDTTAGVTIIKKAGYKREDLNKAEFKKDNRLLYDKYIKFTDIAETVQIKVSKEKNNAV